MKLRLGKIWKGWNNEKRQLVFIGALAAFLGLLFYAWPLTIIWSLAILAIWVVGAALGLVINYWLLLLLSILTGIELFWLWLLYSKKSGLPSRTKKNFGLPQ